MPNLTDIVGQQFGRLTVISIAPERRNGRAMWLCSCECGRTTTVRLSHLRSGGTKGCGCLQKLAGSLSPNWKGGRNIRADGYVKLYSPNHSRADSNGYVLEHIPIMENKLGRALLLSESVHHKNGVRHDNRPSNLELRASDHGPGQSIPDLIEFWTEKLREYAPERLDAEWL